MSKIELNPTTSLLVIDIQERLLSAMSEMESKRIVHHTETLIMLANAYGASVFYSEQYPKGLGPTASSLKPHLSDASYCEKTSFDVCEASAFDVDALQPTVIVVGMEAHICVQSTVSSLLASDRRVIVPFDAVLSRDPMYKTNGLEWMKRDGAEISNVESIVFQTLKDAKSDHFKVFSKRIQ